MNDPANTGAARTATALPKRVNDLRGQTFGLLTVLEYVGPIGKSRHGYWSVQCSCPAKKIFNVIGTTLTNGDTRSCGCLRVEAGKENATHGMTRTPEYWAWKAAKARCADPTHRSYYRYGARGITMSVEFVDSFEAFFEHVGPRPSPYHTMDRLDNNRGYERGNLAWRTRKQQQRNRGNNRLITFNGETLTISEWAERLNTADGTIRNRIEVLGWSIKKALTTPVGNQNKKPAPENRSGFEEDEVTA